MVDENAELELEEISWRDRLTRARVDAGFLLLSGGVRKELLLVVRCQVDSAQHQGWQGDAGVHHPVRPEDVSVAVDLPSAEIRAWLRGGKGKIRHADAALSERRKVLDDPPVAAGEKI